MSGRFDDIDLNSDVAPAERNDEVHGVNTSETLTGGPSSEVRLGEGSGSVAGGNGAQTGIGHRNRGDGAEGFNMSTEGEFVAPDGGIALGLEVSAVKDSARIVNDEHMDNYASWEAVADRTRSTSRADEEEGKVATSDGACCSKEGDAQDRCLNESKDEATDMQQPEDIVKRNAEQADLELESQGKKRRTEKEGQFHLNDLVWGKVKSHPWWPGQILDPSESTEKAKKYSRKDGFLVAYFGDQTFAWNDASRLKPFRTYFAQMDKQSNSEAFCNAVGCALDEVSRRVEFGFACSCLSPGVLDKIKTQVIINAGIREESSRRNGTDEYSSVVSFKPMNLVHYLKGLAQSPCSGTDGLEIVTARAELLAFNRWKGCHWLPEFKMLGGLSEEGLEDTISVLTNNEPTQLGKRKLAVQNTSSLKRKQISGDGVSPRKKERRISDLMSHSQSNLPSGKSELEKEAGRKLTSASSVKKRTSGNYICDNAEVKTREFSVSLANKPQLSRVGESIRRVASRLTVSSPVLRDRSRKPIGEHGSNKKAYKSESEKFRRRKITAAEYSSPHDMLSQLYLTARDPMRGQSLLISSVDFFSNYRNSYCIENSSNQRQEKLTGETSGKQIDKAGNSETTETSGFDGMEDSYWTDRIVQSNSEEKESFEPEIPTKKGNSTVEQGATINLVPAVDCKLESPVVNCDPEEQVSFKPEIPTGNGNSIVKVDATINSSPVVGSELENPTVKCEEKAKAGGHLDEISEEEDTPTALVLNFTDFDSVPSGSNLNKIFGSYGPLIDNDTEVLEKTKRAKVVFRRRSDAENAFSSTGKFSIFGPSLVSYRLKYLPSSRKTFTSALKRQRKGVTSVDDDDAI
ncbi:Non-specific serine/threonine protein kinase [Bertholletia excelsa]